MKEINIADYYSEVVSLAKRRYEYLRAKGVTYIELNDLKQEGFLGLVQAKKSFNPEKNVKFSTYAYLRINGAISDYLRKLDPLSVKKRMELEEYKQAKEKLLQKLEREPIRKEIAEELGVSEEEVKKRERLQIFFVSLEETYFTDEGIEVKLSEQIPSPGSDPLDPLEKKELAKAIGLCLETLSIVEKEIIIQRGYEERPLREVAKSMDMTIPTVQRKEKEALKKLKDCLEKKGWSVKDLP